MSEEQPPLNTPVVRFKPGWRVRRWPLFVEVTLGLTALGVIVGEPSLLVQLIAHVVLWGVFMRWL